MGGPVTSLEGGVRVSALGGAPLASAHSLQQGDEPRKPAQGEGAPALSPPAAHTLGSHLENEVTVKVR